MNDALHKAMNATDHSISLVEGLLHGLERLAREYDGTNNPDPTANAIMAIIDVLELQVSDIIESRRQEWMAVRDVAA